MVRWSSRSWVKGLFAFVLVLGIQIPAVAGAHPASNTDSTESFCESKSLLCTDPYNHQNYDGSYVGHDEPATLFYSNTPGSGNSNDYLLTLPKDPPTAPKQNGTGGTFNFELHPAFWFGMAMCDTMSAPNPQPPPAVSTCTPDSDTNIFDNPDPTAPDYIGLHPGAAFMEMQFYPPGWVLWPPGNSCDATKWCAALNIDSYPQNMNTNQLNNSSCLNSVGQETVNFAFITLDGTAQAPANPLSSALHPNAVFTPNPTKDLFMNPGDILSVDMHDTTSGFRVVVNDLTSATSGSMTASPANGFGQVVFDPNATTCTVNPYAFHPMYSTSSEHTRVPWAAHSYNVAMSDEIGHFEFCNGADQNGNCTIPGVGDRRSGVDSDDYACFVPPNLPAGTRIQVGGCIGEDLDFDGVPYGLNWPGTLTTPSTDATLHPQPIRFTSPLFNGTQNYDRVAFETDLPAIEIETTPPCDTFTGANCTDPPTGARFYPLFTTGQQAGKCVWQLGGAYIPGTTNTFGGSSTAEYGSLLRLWYPSVGSSIFSLEDFRQVLPTNPCAN